MSKVHTSSRRAVYTYFTRLNLCLVYLVLRFEYIHDELIWTPTEVIQCRYTALLFHV